MVTAKIRFPLDRPMPAAFLDQFQDRTVLLVSLAAYHLLLISHF